MADARRDEAVIFLQKAANALLAAQVMIGARGEMHESLIFHAQQAAEDALRGFLAAHGETIKGKNLAALLSQCVAVNPALLDAQLIKTDYPEAALAQAKKLLEMVKTLLPTGIKEAL